MSLTFQWWRLRHRHRDRVRRRVIRYSIESGLAEADADIAEAIGYLQKNPLHIFPYPFARNYAKSQVRVKHDREIGLRYVEHLGMRLYWREGGDLDWVRRNYTALRREQDERSAHRYLVPGFDVHAGDVVADIGCAEAMLALEVVEQARHVYLFESDERWLKALEATFGPWKEKVTICHATLGAKSGQGRVTLDEYFAEKTAPNFYKLDVEGAEAEVLNGARHTLARAVTSRVAVCAYHRHEDEANLTKLLRELAFNPEPSRGYLLLFDEEDFTPPYFRRGLLRATKE